MGESVLSTALRTRVARPATFRSGPSLRSVTKCNRANCRRTNATNETRKSAAKHRDLAPTTNRRWRRRMSANVGDEFAGSVDLPAGVGDPSVSAAAEPTIDVPSVPVSPTEPFASSLEMNANADPESSAPDEEVSPTPDADLTADTNGEEQSADGPSPVESADSTGNVSASIATDSAADSVLFDDGPGSGADFADVAEGSYASDA